MWRKPAPPQGPGKSRLQDRQRGARGAITGKETSTACSTAAGAAKVIQECLRSSDIEAAEAHLVNQAKDFRGASCKKAFYHSVISACARAGSAEAAVVCARRMARAGLRPDADTVNSLLQASVKVGDVDLATQVWRVMAESGIGPNAVTYNTMFSACAQASDAQMAETWLEKMRAEGFAPCAASFSTLMAAFAGAGQADKAEFWFERMREAHIKPDRTILNSMVAVSLSAALPDRAEYWLLQMMEAGLKPAKQLFNSVIQAWCKQGNTERALHWFGEMETCSKPDRGTFKSLICANILAGDIQGAVAWMNVMQSRGLNLTTSMHNDVLHNGFGRRNDYEGAMWWCSKMVDSGIRPNNNTRSRLVSICERSGTNCEVVESMLGQWIEAGDNDATDDEIEGKNFDASEFPNHDFGDGTVASGSMLQGPPGLPLPGTQATQTMYLVNIAGRFQ